MIAATVEREKPEAAPLADSGAAMPVRFDFVLKAASTPSAAGVLPKGVAAAGGKANVTISQVDEEIKIVIQAQGIVNINNSRNSQARLISKNEAIDELFIFDRFGAATRTLCDNDLVRDGLTNFSIILSAD